ncbi:MAG: P-II family nitrogen regulator, partial [Planctomycetota bacterium]
KGFGRQKRFLESYADTEFNNAFVPKVEICVWVEEHCVEEIINKITAVCRNGRMGDGKIIVLPAMGI